MVFALIMINSYEIQPEDSSIHFLVIDNDSVGLIVLCVVERMLSNPIDDWGWITDDEQGCYKSHLNLPKHLSNFDELEVSKIRVIIGDFPSEMKISLL